MGKSRQLADTAYKPVQFYGEVTYSVMLVRAR